MALKNLGLEACKPTPAPRVRQTLDQVLTADHEEQLGEGETQLYRSVLMRLAFISHDRPDLSESIKALAQRMRKPTATDMTALKHLGRY
eukprot:6465518-Amphidinium_carterae.1